MAPSFSRVSSGALLLALAYNAQPVKADFWEDVDNCELVLNDLPADTTTDFCNDWTYGYQPEEEYTTVTGYPITVTEYPDAKTCDDGGYVTATKEGYPASTPEPSNGYETSKPTSKGSKTTKVPDETTKVPSYGTEVPDYDSGVPHNSTMVPGETTKAPDQPPPTNVPESGWDVTVTSTVWTTYWITSTVYPDSYPTPAPYRRHARDLNDGASWCGDRPCRLVQYADDTIVEACKKYLGWAPVTKTVNVPGYTVTETSYPTDCKQKDGGYESDPVSAYPTENNDGFQADPYPTETDDGYQAGPLPTETDDGYQAGPLPTETDDGYQAGPYPTEPLEDSYTTETPSYPEYPTETPEYQPYTTEEPDYQPYPTDAPAPYPEDDGSYDNEPSYDDGSDSDPSYDDGSYDNEPSYDGGSDSDPSYDDGSYDNEPSYDGGSDSGSAPWESDFDNNYSGSDGPKPWDDAAQTQELADAIAVGGYDSAINELGLDDAQWNALPVDYADNSGEDYKRRNE